MKMKKQYIQPESHIVVVKLIGSVLAGIGFGNGSQGADELSRQSNDRFDWDTADDDEESPAAFPKTPW
jgi:hypothetical protein